MSKQVRRFTFTLDETRVVEVPTGPLAKIAVYARRASGAGTATLAVYGTFATVGTDTNLRVQITAATSVGTGVLTPIGTAAEIPYQRLVLVWDATGTIVGDVVVVAY